MLSSTRDILPDPDCRKPPGVAGILIGWRWQGLATAGPLCGGGVARAAMTLSVSVVFGIRREIVRSNNREVKIAYRRFGYCGIALLELFFGKG
jgi:hypothetical protein